ncbi:MAG: DNA repair protein RecO, partial [Bacilli bacterium]|nr:DNA repair protein RecO [Bacilli bacterium]
MIEKVEGIIISERDYGETSKIINVITKEYGIIGMIAKGCKTMKSSLRSVTGKLTYGYFHIYYKQDKLSMLSCVDIINNFKNIKTDIEKISYASFLLDLSEQVIRQNNSADIYDLLINGLLKIDEGFDPLVVTNIIELQYLDFLGVMPIIDRCSICGSTTSIATLSAHRGGYICNSCLKNDKIVSDKTIKLIRMFCYVDIAK